ncbi:MAG: hypothetical protein Q9181_002098 [Wetmoreana brouardii]
MATQYDAIGALYEEMRKLPAAQLQDYNFKKAVAPYAKDAKVLDLACGTGHNAKTVSDMGAAHVVGIDISSEMIEVAKATSTSDKLTFHIGDCSKPVRFEEGPFDLVLGVWLLNYAGNAEEMLDMCRNIAMNLKENGRFLGVTPHPTNDPKRHIERAAAARPVQYGNVTVTVRDEAGDGVATHLVAVTGQGNIEFDAYHLKRDIYEKSAKEGGLNGALVWEPVQLPAEYTAESWNSYLALPHFGILHVSKS